MDGLMMSTGSLFYVGVFSAYFVFIKYIMERKLYRTYGILIAYLFFVVGYMSISYTGIEITVLAWISEVIYLLISIKGRIAEKVQAISVSLIFLSSLSNIVRGVMNLFLGGEYAYKYIVTELIVIALLVIGLKVLKKVFEGARQTDKQKMYIFLFMAVICLVFQSVFKEYRLSDELIAIGVYICMVSVLILTAWKISGTQAES